MLVLALPRHLVESSLPAVEQRLARRPDAWSTLAVHGKLRRLLGDRGGLDDLRSAAGAYLRAYPHDPSLLTPAHLLLLAGDDAAVGLLERLRAEGESRTLVEARFLLGDDAEVPAPVRARPVTLLAAGRATGDLALLDEAVDVLGRQAARERAPATGGMSGNDWLEVALVTRVQVSGRPSDRLVEL
ncbi:MAG: hypothetical protein JWM62_2341 [Frankiales bacterium]|nr:hypothetical protein [Frankiales bacterium]